MSRGYFGIGIVGGKCTMNVGTLWRSAYQLGAQFIFTAGARYPHQASDTLKAWRHLPLYQYATPQALVVPSDCEPIIIEEGGTPLFRFRHPERAIYILGAEDRGVPKEILSRGYRIVTLESERTPSFNVAVAGSIVMWHRQAVSRASRSAPTPGNATK